MGTQTPPPVQQPDLWTLIALLVLSAALVIVFAYNAWQCWRDWRADRDAASLRTLLMGGLLLLGMVVIFLGRLAVFYPNDDSTARTIIRVMGIILSGSIIATGIGLTISWRRFP
jgi:hypothetical protein